MSSLFLSLGVTIDPKILTDALTKLKSLNEGPVFQLIIDGNNSIKLLYLNLFNLGLAEQESKG